MTATEYIILVDDQDCEIGVAEKLAAHQQNLLHRAFSVFIFRENQERELLLQQRAFDKYHSGGLWTNTCCSHPRKGEDTLSAGKRRLREELGLVTSLTDVGRFHYNVHFSNGLSENEMDHVLIGTIAKDTPIIPNPEEIHAYRWITLPRLQQELAAYPEQFTPWFAQALEIASL